MSKADSIISSIQENKIKKNNMTDIDIKFDNNTDSISNNDSNTVENQVINKSINNDKIQSNKSNSKNEIKSYIPSWLTLTFYIDLFTNYKFIIISLIIITLVSLILSLYFYNLDIVEYANQLIKAIDDYGKAIALFLYKLFLPVIDFFTLLFYGAETTVKNTEKGVMTIVDASDGKLDDNDSNEDNIEINENLKKDIDKTIQKNEVVLPDYTNGPVQTNTGWCFIGAEEGARKCVKMNGNICMSNQIFDSKQKCVDNNK
tara:strand:+ start:1169 stop:1945 length:777 start_codon:yes stop_codon:yes gene_type:complete